MLEYFLLGRDGEVLFGENDSISGCTGQSRGMMLVCQRNEPLILNTSHSPFIETMVFGEN